MYMYTQAGADFIGLVFAKGSPREVSIQGARKSLPRAATRCDTLQHTATHCNTLQHTAREVSIKGARKFT